MYRARWATLKYYLGWTGTANGRASLFKARGGGWHSREGADKAVDGFLGRGSQALHHVRGQHFGEHERKMGAHALAERHLAEGHVDAPHQPRRAPDVRQHVLRGLAGQNDTYAPGMFVARHVACTPIIRQLTFGLPFVAPAALLGSYV